MSSEGCNALIRNRKATLVTSADDIVAEMGWDLHEAECRPSPNEPVIELSRDEAGLLSLIGDSDPVSITRLQELTALDSGTPDKNLSGQNTSKVLVNYEEGEISAKGVTAAVLQLPEALLAADASNLSRATLVFNVFKANNWLPEVFSQPCLPVTDAPDRRIKKKDRFIYRGVFCSFLLVISNKIIWIGNTIFI